MSFALIRTTIRDSGMGALLGLCFHLMTSSWHGLHLNINNINRKISHGSWTDMNHHDIPMRQQVIIFTKTYYPRKLNLYMCCPMSTTYEDGTLHNLSHLLITWFAVLPLGWFVQRINSSPPSAGYMRQWTGSALVQIMACHLFGAMPLFEPMLDYCQLDP